ncbi:MAG: YbdK family carboxylate-amine ligase [Thermodesulfobacteriota bacterium]|nr:YbdK family carboxylate-amine ligase [Thermodesulfobacteriota bacterium]
MEPLVFHPSQPFTLGVELEFQLLDPVTLDLIPRGPDLLSKVEPELRNQVKPEFIQSMVEVCTTVCQDMTEVAENLDLLCHYLETLGQDAGCLPYATSLHPFARLKKRHVSPAQRYHEIMDELQIVGRRMITQALHVHIGLEDKESLIRLCDSIRTFLPVLLALSTSSPYWQEEDTGMHSYRTCLFQNLPRSGIPAVLGSWENFEELIVVLNQATLLSGIRELWWDVRPHPDFGTIEIRLCDLPCRFDEILAIVALVQALCATLIKREPQPFPPQDIIIHNKWHAARYGLSGTFINSRPGRHSSFATAVEELLELVRDEAKNLGGYGYLGPIKRILQQGASSRRQRKLYEKYGSFPAMIEKIQQDFWK